MLNHAASNTATQNGDWTLKPTKVGTAKNYNQRRLNFAQIGIATRQQKLKLLPMTKERGVLSSIYIDLQNQTNQI
jgi:hypothetical protein